MRKERLQDEVVEGSGNRFDLRSKLRSKTLDRFETASGSDAHGAKTKVTKSCLGVGL